MRYTIKSITAVIIAMSTLPLTAMKYQWESHQSEPGFSLDVPDNWEPETLEKGNGVVVLFREKRAYMEVRSMTLETDTDIDSLINMKSARLAARYQYIRLLGQQKSLYRNDIQIVAWEIRNKGETYIDRSAFLIQDDQAVALSCLSSKKYFSYYSAIFENAIYSLSLMEGGESRRVDINKLKLLFFFNRPNNDKSLVTGSISSSSDNSTGAEKKNDKKKKKKKKKKKTSNTDSFLPAID